MRLGATYPLLAHAVISPKAKGSKPWEKITAAGESVRALINQAKVEIGFRGETLAALLEYVPVNGRILYLHWRKVRCRIPNMKAKRVRLSDQVRRAVDSCGASRYRLSKATGLSQSQLSRFMAGHIGLSMHALDMLADVLQLRIVVGGPAAVPPLGRPGRKPKKGR